MWRGCTGVDWAHGFGGPCAHCLCTWCPGTNSIIRDSYHPGHSLLRPKKWTSGLSCSSAESLMIYTQHTSTTASFLPQYSWWEKQNKDRLKRTHNLIQFNMQYISKWQMFSHTTALSETTWHVVFFFLSIFIWPWLLALHNIFYVPTSSVCVQMTNKTLYVYL